MTRLTTGLTPKQARVLEFITQWVQEQGYPPAFQQLRQGLDLTEERNAFRHGSAGRFDDRR